MPSLPAAPKQRGPWRVFLLVEEYEDEDAYQAHAASEHFRRYALEEGIPLLESRERSYFAPIDTDAA